MLNSEKFWDKLSNGYEKTPVKNVEAYNQSIEATKKHLKANDLVLECGCGTGSIALELAGSVKELTAIDISSKMIEIAQRKSKDQGIENINFMHSTLFDDRLKKESVNVVLAFNVLHLLEDTPKVIRRIRELLKPGGLFISGTVCLAENNRFLSLLINIQNKLRLIQTIHCFTFSELENAMTNEMFQILETEVFFPDPPVRFIVTKK